MHRAGAMLVTLVAIAAAAVPAAQAGDPWRALHRPMHLPRLAPGARCPVSAVDRRVDWEAASIFGGSGTGRGPVYPGIGGAAGHVTLVENSQFRAPWLGQKVFWYAAPSYKDRVLIRGARIDGPGTLRFGAPGLARELRIRPGNGISWTGQPRGSRGAPSYIRAQNSGCYAVQIDGTSFSRVVVFALAVTP
jgi:hypothetical protein